jgi:hypothetical protein
VVVAELIQTILRRWYKKASQCSVAVLGASGCKAIGACRGSRMHSIGELVNWLVLAPRKAP